MIAKHVNPSTLTALLRLPSYFHPVHHFPKASLPLGASPERPFRAFSFVKPFISFQVVRRVTQAAKSPAVRGIIRT